MPNRFPWFYSCSPFNPISVHQIDQATWLFHIHCPCSNFKACSHALQVSAPCAHLGLSCLISWQPSPSSHRPSLRCSPMSSFLHLDLCSSYSLQTFPRLGPSLTTLRTAAALNSQSVLQPAVLLLLSFSVYLFVNFCLPPVQEGGMTFLGFMSTVLISSCHIVAEWENEWANE